MHGIGFGGFPAAEAGMGELAQTLQPAHHSALGALGGAIDGNVEI